MKSLFLILFFLILPTAYGLTTADSALLGVNGRNYVSNGGAEQGRAGWITYADAAGTTPVDCTGGSPASTWTTSGTTPLSGTYSFIWTHSAANRQGEGASYAFSVDKADQARLESISFDYEVASGTFVAGVNPPATAVDSDLEVYIYDVTNSTIIQPSNYKLLQNSGQARFQGTFQTASNSQSYRLCLHAATTTTAAHTLRVDSVKVGPQIPNTGPPVSDWQTYTPTGSWSANTTYTGFYRRVGDSMQVRVKLALAGAPTSAALTAITAPAGYSWDTTKVQTLSADMAIGNASIFRGADKAMGQIHWSGTGSTVDVYYDVGDGSAARVTQAAPGTFANNDFITFEYTMPIQGWASNVPIGSTDDGRLVSMYATANPPTGTITGTASKSAGWVAVTDTHGTLSSSTYTIPISGIYDLHASIVTSSNTDAGQYKATVFSITAPGGGAVQYGQTGNRTASTGTLSVDSTLLGLQLNAGTTVEVWFLSNATTPIFSNVAGASTWSIVKRASGSQIAAAESINARYFASATSISGSLATISWTTKDYDSHGAMSSGTYTCPAPGKYQVNTLVTLSAGSAAAGNAVDMQLQKNGTVVSEVAPLYQSTQVTLPVVLSDIISCAAGDTVRVQLSSGSTSPAIVSSNSKNYFSITRVGN